MSTGAAMSVQDLTTMIREDVERLHGRPTKRRGVQVVITEVVCTDHEPHWIAKVKLGGSIIAKTPVASYTPEEALLILSNLTRKALGMKD